MTSPRNAHLYDVFISYSKSDQQWVWGWLVPRLRQAGFSVCTDRESFDIGVPRLVNMENAVAASRHTLLVLTPAWVESQWHQFEAFLAQAEDPAGFLQRTLPLLLERCDMPRRLAMLSCADFTGETDEAEFEKLIDAVRGTRRLPSVAHVVGAPDLVTASSEPLFVVPFIRNPDFVGREEDLDVVHETLQKGGAVGIRSAVVLPTGLTGMGGIGKTQLAVEYAYRYKDVYPEGVLWVNAAEGMNLEFGRLVTRVKPSLVGARLDEQVRAVADYLRKHPDSLLILDNVIDPTDLNRPLAAEVVPAALPCRVLFTTRRHDIGRFLAVEVSVLPENAALQLLLRHPKRRPALDPTHPDYGLARRICAVLGYLPLALEVAGAQIGRRPGVPLALYYQELVKRGALPVLDDPRTRLRSEDLPTRHNAAVTATLSSQWETLESDEARLLLRVAGQLPEAAVIPTVFLALLAGLSSQEKDFFGSPSELALLDLEDASLVEELREKHVRLHPLVREFAAQQTPENETLHFRMWCAANLASAYEDFAILEEHCADRGIDALQEDLTIALNLLENIPPQDRADVTLRLEELHRLIQREACNLRGWDPKQQAVFFAQQTYNRAVDLGLTRLTTGAKERLSQPSQPHYRLLWRIGPATQDIERTLVGHEGVISGLALTPDARYAVSASEDCTIKVWDLQTGRDVRTLRSSMGKVSCVAIAPDGQQVISASEDGRLRVWDLSSGQIVRTMLVHTGKALAVAITPDGSRAVSGSNHGNIGVWNLRTGEEVCSLRGHSDGAVRAIAITPDGRWAISGSTDRTLRVWDLQTGQYVRTLHGHTRKVFAATVSVDGKYVISASGDQTLRVWDIQTGQLVRVIAGHKEAVNAVACIPGSHLIVSAADDRTLKIWDMQTGQEIHTFSGHGGKVTAVAATRTGSRVVSGAVDRTLRVWSLQSGQSAPAFVGHREAVRTAVITPDNRRIITGSEDKTIGVWSASRGEKIYQLVGHEAGVNSVALTPDGGRLISASTDRTLRIWSLQVGKEVFVLQGHTDRVNSVVVTPDGYWAISASHDNTLRAWDLHTGEEVRTLVGNETAVRTVAVVNNRFAVSGAEDGSLRAWDLLDRQQLRIFHGHADSVRAVAITRGSPRVVSASEDSTIRVWDFNTGQGIATLTEYRALVPGIATMPNPNQVLLASYDCSLRLWDFSTGQILATAKLDNPLHCVAVTAGGQKIVIGDSAGNLYCLRYVE